MTETVSVPELENEAAEGDADASIVPHLVHFESPTAVNNGPAMLEGYLWRPHGKGPFPAVVYNHGSEQDPGDKASVAEYFVRHGYVVFVPHRRGHGGSPGVWILTLPANQRIGELDKQVDDVVAALHHLGTEDFVDDHRIAVMGGSFGGIETLLAAEHDLWHDHHHPRIGFRAAVDFGGAAESWSSQSFQQRLTQAVKNATVPVFFLQAENDYTTQPSKSLAAVAAEQGRPHQMMIFPHHYTSVTERVVGSDLDHSQGHGGFFGSPSEWGPWVLGFLSANLEATVSILRVSPKSTDPAIDDHLDDHYVLLDSVSTPVGNLLVWLPGTGGVPAGAHILLTEAARAGYHVIGLTYHNDDELNTICLGGNEDCPEKVCQSIINGGPLPNSTTVSPASSIMNRLTRLLHWLVNNNPEGGWGAYLEHGEPAWSKITIAGHSQGGAHSAYIAKMHEVSRVVTMSSPGGGLGVSPPAWLHHHHVTPNERYYALLAVHDPRYGLLKSGCDALGLGGFGEPVDVEQGTGADGEWPYGNSHILTTHHTNDPHNSTAVDGVTPLLADGAPFFRKAWRYVIGP
jgi:dienelactone hydrolase